MAVLKLAAVALVLASPVSARAETALERILAESAKAPVVGFERTTRADLRADPAKEPALVVDRFTPKSATTGAWTVVSVEGRKPTPQELEVHAKNNSSPPGFHNLHKLLSLPPTSRAESGGRTVYYWKSLPKGSVITPGGDVSAHLSAEAVLEEAGAKPALSEVRVFAAKPFRVKVVASINKFNVVSVYRAGANGLPFLVAQASETDVSAPLGMGGKRRSTASFKPLD